MYFRFGLFLTLLLAIMSNEIEAQIQSPEVHSDQTVTFRLRAPDAKSVQVVGLHDTPVLELEKGENGIWSGTTDALEPELYSYVFRVDGLAMLDPSNRLVKKWLTCQNMVLVPGKSPRLYEQSTVPHGALHQHYYESKAAGHERRVFVYTPPGYEETTQDYKTLFLLHGYGDDASAWTEVGRANFIADNLIAHGIIEPVVIVMPYGHPQPIQIGGAFDDYAERNMSSMEADLLEDLMPFVSSKYRVAKKAEDRAIAGLSMGGGQALTIGLRHTELFAHIGGFSSASPQPDPGDEGLSIDDKLDGLSANADKVNEQLINLWIACGTEDFLLERNRQFVSWLKEVEIKHDYFETEGAHDWVVWRVNLPGFLTKAFPLTN